MAGKFLCVDIHFVWSTKGRRSLIEPEWRGRLQAYLGSVAHFKNAKLIEANSQPDHIHLYASMPSTVSIAELVNAFKANSTRWIRRTFPNRKWFSWQEGYAAFSVSRASQHAVIEYIRNQDEHHRRVDFREELLGLLELHGIEYDPRYVFD
jgi:REP element-mobilizing transposase RayT